MPISIKPDMNYGVWAEGGNIEIPSSQKVEQGWVVEKPLNETMNWLQNRQDRMLQYLNERGIAEWDIRTAYPLNAYVAHNGVVYKALSPNTDKNPATQTNIWTLAFVSYSDFVTYSNTVNSITTNDGFLKHYVKKSDPVMNSAAKAPAYRNPENTAGLGFDLDKPSIVRNGKVVVEFSGGTNPKDVVTHEQLAFALQSYKVGDIYITTSQANPFERFGYGSWQRFGEGRTLVGFSSSVSNDTPEWVKIGGREYGSFTHKLTVEEMPSHTHDFIVDAGNGTGNYPEDTSQTSFNYRAKTEPTGGDKPHNNVQPSVVVYFWKRTA